MNTISDLVVLYPLGLVGLATLLIPVLIHLFSRSRGRKVLIGHIELVRAAKRQRVSELRLSQWLLLAVRLLLFMLAALILAQLARQGLSTVSGDVAIVTPGWVDTEGASALEELQGQYPGGVIRLAPSPKQDQPLVQENIWPQLAEQLSTTQYSGTVTVFATGLVTELGENLPSLPADLTWRVTESTSLPAELPQPQILVLHDPTRLADAATVSAALEALRRHRLPGLRWQIEELDNHGATETAPDWLILLTDTPVSLDWADEPPTVQLQVQAASTDPGFPQELLDALLGDNGLALAFAQARVNPERLQRASQNDHNARLLPNRSLQTWLALLMISLWLLERWLSGRRRT